MARGEEEGIEGYLGKMNSVLAMLPKKARSAKRQEKLPHTSVTHLEIVQNLTQDWGRAAERVSTDPLMHLPGWVSSDMCRHFQHCGKWLIAWFALVPNFTF